jgi:hypothetical protein
MEQEAINSLRLSRGDLHTSDLSWECSDRALGGRVSERRANLNPISRCENLSVSVLLALTSSAAVLDYLNPLLLSCQTGSLFFDN